MMSLGPKKRQRQLRKRRQRFFFMKIGCIYWVYLFGVFKFTKLINQERIGQKVRRGRHVAQNSEV